MRSVPLLLASLLLLTGCLVRHPLGIADEEWKRMTPEQQLAARQRQTELDRAEAERKARAEAARRRELAERRAHARYGDIVQCVIEDGIAKIGSKLRDVDPVAFSRVRGEGDEMTIRSKGGKRSDSLWAEFQEDGMTVRLCSGGRWDRDCATLIATASDFRAGIERRLIIDSKLNVRVRCSFAPGSMIIFSH